MSFTIQRLHEGVRAALVAHFLALPVKDRGLRFGMMLAPTVIASYVSGIDFNHDAVFGVHDEWLALVGAAHVAFTDAGAEVALSVLPQHRRRGIATALFTRAMTHARSLCIPGLYMQFLLGNGPIRRIAQKFGMDIVNRGDDAFAHLRLQPAAPGRIADERDEVMPVGWDGSLS